MRTRITMIICLCLLLAGGASVQWVVSGPDSLAQGVINASKNTIHTPETAMNMVSNLRETVKTYQQGKKYRDVPRLMNNLVKDARKMQQTILMVDNITDIYVNSFQRILRDGNFRLEELSATAFGYMKLLEESNEVLTELRNVVNIATLSMTNKECIDVVGRCHSKMKCYRDPVSYYAGRDISVNYLYAGRKNDLNHITGLYGSMNERYWQPTRFDSLYQIPRLLYGQVMPLCGDMADIAKGIAGLGALSYVTYQIWQSSARAEPIDILPMLCLSTIGLCTMFFPTVMLGAIDGTLSPVIQGITKMLETETLDMNRYRKQKDKSEYEAMIRSPKTAYLVSNEESDRQPEELG